MAGRANHVVNPAAELSFGIWHSNPCVAWAALPVVTGLSVMRQPRQGPVAVTAVGAPAAPTAMRRRTRLGPPFFTGILLLLLLEVAARLALAANPRNVLAAAVRRDAH